MKYAADMTACHCCDPEVPVCPGTATLTNPNSHRERLLLQGDTDDPAGLFDFEPFEHGGTVDSWSVGTTTYQSQIGATPRNYVQTAALVDLSVTGSQFTAGVHFWPKDVLTVDPNRYAGETLLPPGGISGSVQILNGMGVPPYQYYKSQSPFNLPQPDEARPYPFCCLVMEQDGSLYYGGLMPASFYRCPVSHALAIGLGRGLASDGDFDAARMDHHCFPDPAPSVVDRVGVAFGITTWLGVTYVGGPPGQSPYEERTLPHATYRESVVLSHFCITSTWYESCKCYYRDVASLDFTFGGGDANPVELAGTVITATRAVGGLVYTGSATITGSGGEDINIDLTFDPCTSLTLEFSGDDCADPEPTPGCTTLVIPHELLILDSNCLTADGYTGTPSHDPVLITYGHTSAAGAIIPSPADCLITCGLTKNYNRQCTPPPFETFADIIAISCDVTETP